MADKIDWSRWTEKYPVWIEDTKGYRGGWHTEYDGIGYRSLDGSYWTQGAEESGIIIVHRRPEAAAWDGQGVPPVGCECAAEVEPGRWENCKVVATSGGASWIVSSTDDLIVRHDFVKFRPIPTPEQKAAQDRERELQRMNEIWHSTPVGGSFLEELYDAGLRFTGGES